MNDNRDRLSLLNWKPNKFSKEDEKHAVNRKLLAESIGEPKLFEYIDQFALYAGINTIAQKMFCFEILKESLHVPGHIVEFGVWKGTNLVFLAKLLTCLQPNSHKLVIGFDNFSGLPEPTENDGKIASEYVGRYCGDENILRKVIELYGLDELIYLIVGDALETIPKFEVEAPEAIVSLAFIDFDLYEPTKVALEYLSNRLSIGGIIVFDEALSPAWPGETKAMLEFLNSTKGKYRMKSNYLSRQPSMYIIREA